MARFGMASDERATRQAIADLIVTEDDPDIRGILAGLLAFDEVEVDGELPYGVGKGAMESLDEAGIEYEEIGTNIRRYFV